MANNEQTPLQAEILAKAQEALDRAKADALLARLEVEKWEQFIRELTSV